MAFVLLKGFDFRFDFIFNESCNRDPESTKLETHLFEISQNKLL